MTIVVVGKNSLMGKEMQAHSSTSGWLFLTHEESLVDTSWAEQAQCVINFALSPALRTAHYNADEDIDLKLASLIRKKQSHYIMMSSRMVYGSGGCLHETDIVHPQTIYAKNKRITECSLIDMLDDRLTILRGANVFGHEYGRKSFFGIALSNLRHKGLITFDMNPDVERDFIATWHVADAIVKIVAVPQSGIFNLGSGYGTKCRDIASWIIEGYGAGEIISTNNEMRDGFYLDMSKTKTHFDVSNITPLIMRKDCQICGAALKRSSS